MTVTVSDYRDLRGGEPEQGQYPGLRSQHGYALWTVTNSTDTTSGELPLAGPASMALFSPDSSTVYAPVPSAPVSGARAGSGAGMDCGGPHEYDELYGCRAPTPSRSVPMDNTCLCSRTTPIPLTVIDTHRQPNHLCKHSRVRRGRSMHFSAADSNTAYVLNCGPECGSSGPASVAEFEHSFADHCGHRAGWRRQCRFAEWHNSLRCRKSGSSGNRLPPMTRSTSAT